ALRHRAVRQGLLADRGPVYDVDDADAGPPERRTRHPPRRLLPARRQAAPRPRHLRFESDQPARRADSRRAVPRTNGQVKFGLRPEGTVLLWPKPVARSP